MTKKKVIWKLIMDTRVVIISFPWKSHNPSNFLTDIIHIILPISEKVVLIGGNTDRIKVSSKKLEIRDIGISMHYLSDFKFKFFSAIYWILKSLLAQIKISIELIKTRKNVDTVIFYAAYPHYLIPLIIAKILRKKTIEVVIRNKNTPILDQLYFKLLDGISPESNALIEVLGLDKYKKKLLPNGSRYIDESFTIKKRLNERKNIVGFIGRLVKEKGIFEFIEAIPQVLKKNNDLNFLIVGNGPLKSEIEKLLDQKDLSDKVKISGWIPHEKIPYYLNKVNLLVLPTYTEGFPTIILEAMACGTPVLSTSSGGIFDIINDMESGFIMKNNTPSCISKNIIRALNYPNIEKIVTNARKTIDEEFSYESAVERYKKILSLQNSEFME
ncbi:MAG: glycosyltransferase family 4 protein [Methanobacterium sp.]